ncbi:helix-turn-helix domain-containing protein [Coprococcus catus]|uniref:helix-turn-helix domain-containing protein n=2 Tax=Coprococcus catus TaxID=116085 RepID=UPI00207A811E|nr:helix-turn-helix transcriptional regulator [Coprococcus catus]
MKIGNFLKELRKEKGITQAQLAETLNVSARTVSRWETGSNMPDISLLVDIADYYDISIPEIINGERKSEIMNEEERKIAKTMSDYATTEKEKIFKEMKIQSIMGVCALVLYWILHETDAYMYSDALEKLTGYCETLVSVSVIMMAAYTTGSLSKLRSKSWKFFMIENLPKPVRLIVSAVVAFCGAAMIKLALVHFFGL